MPPLRGTPSNERAFRTRFHADRPNVTAVADSILAWATAKPLKRKYTTAPDQDSCMCRYKLGVQEHKVLTLETSGLVWILFEELAARFPTRDTAHKTRILAEFEARLSQVPGRASSGSFATQAAWQLESIDTAAFLGVLDWLVDQLKSSYAETLGRDRKL